MAEKKDWLNDSERNIFLTGQAGTGKTYKIAEFVENERKKGHMVLISATTGTAAVNAGGQTAHSLFGIPVPCMGVPISKAPAAQIKVLAKADTIVIDEISMMRNDSFSFAMRVLKKAERLKGSKIRVVVIGDFSQLPPVVTKADEKLLKKFGYDTSGYPFTTKEWKSLNFKVVELTEIKRQEDVEFAELLGRVRDCDRSVVCEFDEFVDESYSIYVDEEQELREANESYEDKWAEEGWSNTPDDSSIQSPTKVVNPKLLTGEAIVLCGTNAEADAINMAYMDSIDAPLSAYKVATSGRTTSGIVDDVVLLKVGCRVMFTENDEKRRFQNGTFGVVEACFRDHVLVRLEDGKTINVYPKESTCYQYKVKGGALTKEKTGTVSQIPLKVAAAVTIHKSQGKTFGKAIVSPSVFAAGQLYVALSRVRSPEGLILTDRITTDALVDNEIVAKFYRDGYTFEVKSPAKKTTAKKVVSSTTSKKTTTKKASTKKSSSKSTTAKKGSSSNSKTSGRKASSSNKTTGRKKEENKKTTGRKKSSTKTVSGKKSSTRKTTSSKAKKSASGSKKTQAKKTPAKAKSKSSSAKSKPKTTKKSSTKKGS